jgi:4-hydroxybenzoate polyprenyltransferase
VAIGVSYDVRLKGTAWSWLPFAVGIPLLPVYGWVGATGSLAPWFAVLLPAAVAAGAALAIANSLVDVERDLAAGRTSVAASLGRRRAGWLAAGLLAGVLLLDAASVLAVREPGPAAAASVIAVAVALAANVATIDRAALAELAWRVEAIALGLAALAWIVAIPG